MIYIYITTNKKNITLHNIFYCDVLNVDIYNILMLLRFRKFNMLYNSFPSTTIPVTRLRDRC